MTWIPSDLFIADQDLFRAGNAGGPRLDHVRPMRDIDIDIVDGLPMAIANHKGISLTTRKGQTVNPIRGHIWLLPAGTVLPGGLVLRNDYDEHYSLSPLHTMRLDAFTSLLRVLAPSLTYSFRGQ